MPCNSGSYVESTYHADFTVAKARADEASRAACDLARMLKRKAPEVFHANKGIDSNLLDSTRKWVINHDALDEARIERDERKLRKAEKKYKALSKLTVRERKTLDLVKDFADVCRLLKKPPPI